MSLPTLGANLRDIESGKYKLVILDAWYRFLPGGTNENDNAAVMDLFNRIDRYTAQLQAAWVNIHHASKGDQSQKSTTDVGSGAGSQSRAADAHLALRPHEQDGVSVLSLVVRSFPPVEPLSLEWEFPLWKLSDANPAQLRRPMSGNDLRQQQRDEEGCRQILAILTGDAKLTAKDIRKETGIGRDRLLRLLGTMVAAKRVLRNETERRGNPCDEYSLPPPSWDGFDE